MLEEQTLVLYNSCCILLFIMKSVNEWVDIVAEMECPFIEFSVEGYDLGLDENSLEILEKALNILELHEEEIRRHKQKIQLVMSEYLMRKYRRKKT